MVDEGQNETFIRHKSFYYWKKEINQSIQDVASIAKSFLCVALSLCVRVCVCGFGFSLTPTRENTSHQIKLLSAEEMRLRLISRLINCLQKMEKVF